MSSTIPLWWWGGNPDDDSFMTDPRRKCRNHGDLYYREHDTEALFDCRNICITCPVRRQCARFSIRHYDDEGGMMMHGIWAGYTPTDRKKISEGRMQFYDWAAGWSHRAQARVRARAKATADRKQGISKRELNRLAMPPCPEGHTNVRRSGRQNNQQLYRCRECGVSFRGEDL